MPFPLIGFVAVAIGTAIAGKLAHDVSSSSSSGSSSGSGSSEAADRERRAAERRNADARYRAARQLAADAMLPELSALLARHGIDANQAHFNDEDAEAFCERIIACFEEREHIIALKSRIDALDARIEEAQTLATMLETRA